MVLKLAWKDRLPKTKLHGGYLGDGFPLCSELPPRYFLSKGSTFILTGKSFSNTTGVRMTGLG